MMFFDLDGTLIDSNEVWVAVDRLFLQRRGLDVTQAYTDFVSHSIFPLAAAYTKTCYGLPESLEEIMAEWMDLAWDAYAHQVPLKEGVLDFLDLCRTQGEPMALVTASVPALCQAVLERHGLTGYFLQIIFAQELGLEKRDPQVFHIAAQRCGVTPADCTMFEDSPAGCVSAKQAGLRVIGVHDPFFAAAEEKIRAVCDRYILSFTELLTQ